MEYLPYAFIPLAVWVFVCICGIAPLVLLRYSNFEPVQNPIPIFEKSLEVVDAAWLQEVGFSGSHAIKPLGIEMSIYTDAERTTVICVYFAGGQRVVDIVSILPGRISITTSCSIDGPLFVSPSGMLFQAFASRDAKELLRIHRNGVEYLTKQLNAELIVQDDVSCEMRSFITRQLNHQLRRPWRILAIPFRYAITRFTRKNLTVAEQEQRRIIDLESLRRQVKEP
ncbi:MAG: hypothetical protein AAF483_19220 [Planctomycetota bacterium]